MSYSITSDPGQPLSPDISIADIGDPVGTEQGQPYYDWDTVGQSWNKWRLCKGGPIAAYWYIIPREFTDDPNYSGFIRDIYDVIVLSSQPMWQTIVAGGPAGSYVAGGYAQGLAIVAEVVIPPAEGSATLEALASITVVGSQHIGNTGPIYAIEAEVFALGMSQGETYIVGSEANDVYTPGASSQEKSNP